MSVEELQTLHQRYVALSQRFRSAWVFHQFLQSLAKLYFDEFDDRYPDRFQELYGQLKDISQSLNASQAVGMGRRFDGVERQLGELIDALMAEDNRVEPAHLRRFFRRFRTYDEKVLIQLVRFYLYAHHGDSWSPDQLDKIDYLLTRLSEEGPEDEETAAPGLADRARLREVLTSLRNLIPTAPAQVETIEERRREIERLRDEIAAAGDLERLHERALVQRFRALKHGLGELYFEPALALAVLETNRRVKVVIKELYGREERRIFSEYQQIFDLEGQVRPDRDLSADLARFREEVERFERHLQRDEMRLDELAQIRKRVRALMPRLTAGVAGAGAADVDADVAFAAAEQSFEDLGDATLRPGEAATFQAAAAFESTDPTPYHDGSTLDDAYTEGDFSAAAAEAVGEATGESTGDAPEQRPEVVPPVAGDGDESLIQDHFGRLVEALDGTTLGAPPKAVSLTPDVYQYKLEPREVIAYRRLLQRGRLSSASPPDEGWDEALERFILRAASLRVRMNEEAEEIRGILDETVSDVRSPVFQRSRRTVRLGDAYLARFAHLVHQLVLDSQADEARELELLRVRLMHEYSGLWLLSYRQAITERAVAEAG